MPAVNRLPIAGGEIKYFPGPAGTRYGLLREKVSPATAASATLTQTLPARSIVQAAGMTNMSAITLVTAVRYGLGITGDPDLFRLSSTTMTALATHEAEPFFRSRLLYANAVASTAVTAAVATNYDLTTTIQANTLKPGDVIRLHYQGIATSTTGAETLAIRVLIGSFVADTQAAVDVSNNDTFMGTAEVVVRAVGSSGTAVAWVASPVVGAGKTDGTSTVTFRSGFKASATMDTTADQTVAVEVTHSSTGESSRLDVFTVELLRPQGNFYSSSATTLKVASVDSAGTAVGTMAGDVGVWLWFQVFDALPTT